MLGELAKLGLYDKSCADALGADCATDGCAALFYANALKIGHKATTRNAGGVKTDTAFSLLQTVADDAVACHGLLAANFANLGHDSELL
jgi:hypothetical protein